MPSSSRRKRTNSVRNWRTLALFPCEHRQRVTKPPKLSDRHTWCKECAEHRLIAMSLEVWAVECVTCRYARFFDWDAREARRALGRHKTQKQGHTVLLFRNGRLIAKLNAIRDTLPLGEGYSLDDDGSVIPF